MSKLGAQQEAIRRAAEELRKIDLKARLPQLGLPAPESSQSELRLRMLGQDLILDLKSLDFKFSDGSPNDAPKPAKPGDHILVLHYLLCDRPIHPMPDNLITFRELPGGQFYWEPFLSRSVKPLISAIGNNLNRLRTNLGRFDWQSLPIGDLGARIHGLGNIFVTLIYRQGDEEFGPSLDLLFDACIKHVYNAEDAAYLASRVCLGLL